jgi:hypothetical protein
MYKVLRFTINEKKRGAKTLRLTEYAQVAENSTGSDNDQADTE